MPSKKSAESPVSGSPSVGEPEYLAVGILRRPYHLEGELLMELLTDFPERLKRGTTVYVGERHSKMTVAGARQQARGLVIRFAGFDSPEAASQFRNQLVFVKAADLPALPQGMYYHHELIGFQVVNEAGRVVGNLVEILQTGANDVYVIRQDEGRELLLPVIDGVVLGIESSARRIRVREGA